MSAAADMNRQDLIYLRALAIQDDPGPGNPRERMMRRLAAATVQRLMEDCVGQPGSPELSLAQRKTLAEMLELDLDVQVDGGGVV